MYRKLMYSDIEPVSIWEISWQVVKECNLTIEDDEREEDEGVSDEELLFYLPLLQFFTQLFGLDSNFGEEGIEAISLKDIAGVIAQLCLTFEGGTKQIIYIAINYYLKSFYVFYWLQLIRAEG